MWYPEIYPYLGAFLGAFLVGRNKRPPEFGKNSRGASLYFFLYKNSVIKLVDVVTCFCRFNQEFVNSAIG